MIQTLNVNISGTILATEMRHPFWKDEDLSFPTIGVRFLYVKYLQSYGNFLKVDQKNVWQKLTKNEGRIFMDATLNLCISEGINGTTMSHISIES